MYLETPSRPGSCAAPIRLAIYLLLHDLPRAAPATSRLRGSIPRFESGTICLLLPRRRDLSGLLRGRIDALRNMGQAMVGAALFLQSLIEHPRFILASQHPRELA